ncbi:MAG: class I SAM-dependent methyltransferase [Thermodesulfovibrionales bacterium]|nr:class I SAM-dependent methyltransferase [Thermodesulfovibrionales bacterium]
MSVQCPVCSSGNSILKETYGKYGIRLCGDCDLVFSDPMRTDMGFYETSEDYADRDGIMFDSMKWHERWDVMEFLKTPPVKAGSLLDIGCGTGFFVKRAVDMGLKGYGIDFNERSIESGRRRFGLDTLYATDIKGFISANPGLGFDAVTLFHILEHVEDPNRLMDEIQGVLKDNGVLVIAVPLRDRWPDFVRKEIDSPPHHLTRWSIRALEKFLGRNGFRVTRRRVQGFPMDVVTGLIYKFVLKVAPSLTLRGQKVSERSGQGELGEREIEAIMKKRRLKIMAAGVLGFPFWLALKLIGAKGPLVYIEARRGGI